MFNAKVNMLLIMSMHCFSNEFSFIDLDKILKKNSDFYKTVAKTTPSHHKFKGRYSYFKEREHMLFIKNKDRYKSRPFDRFTTKKDLPENHTKLFFDSNPRYSSNALESLGMKKLYAMEE